MDFFSALKISASALKAQRTRLNTISSNLANANTTKTSEGGPYKRKDVVFRPKQLRENFSSMLNQQLRQVKGVEVTSVKEDQKPPRMVYDPRHPDANAKGYVAMPNVNVVEEMVNMINCSRTFEANTTVISTIKGMALQALSINK